MADNAEKTKTKKVSTFTPPENTIEVRVDDFQHGLRVFSDVQMARIKSSGYVLLIMADHVPILGELEGDVELVYNGGIETLENVSAFFMHRNNVLSLLVRDYLA